ncbi:MAG: sigma-70 family RNA polymerase sigma factor [Chitinophagaceae bacterium]
MFTDKPLIDEEVIFQIAQGDEIAFAKLFELYRDRIYSIAFKLTHTTTVAEEIVQDVFLKIWLKRSSLLTIQDFSAYFFVVTRNYAFKALRDIARNYSTTIFSEESQETADNDFQDYLADKEYSLLLQKAVNRLPGQQKDVYRLTKEQGLKREEVARLLHVQPETVKSHLAQAMKNIRHFCLVHLDHFIWVPICLRFFLDIQK